MKEQEQSAASSSRTTAPTVATHEQAAAPDLSGALHTLSTLRPRGTTPAPANALQLQRAIGNQAVGTRLGARAVIQRVGHDGPPPALTRDQIVRHPDWPAEAEAYEKRLGAYCYRHPKARDAADRALRRMHEVLSDYFTPAGKSGADIAGAFLKDDNSSAGQVGTSQPERKLAALFERGNLRERMTAFYNAAYYKAGYASDPGISFKAILHDITMDSPSFDERTSNTLGLDTKALRGQSSFLRGRSRKAIKGLIKRVQADKKYTFARDIFALGNLNYQHSTGALSEMVASQRDRVDRSAADKAHGIHKRTAMSYADRGTPLSERELAYLQEHDKPLVISELTIDPGASAGTHVDPATGDRVTLDDIGRPAWGSRPEVDTVGGAPRRTFRSDDPELGTRQEIEIVDSPTGLGMRAITWKHLLLRPADSFLPAGHAGPELPLDWIEGNAWFDFREGSAWVDKIHHRLGMPVVAGVSGTTTRMLSAFNWLNVGGCDSLEFRLAIMGWMLTSWDHSLYEILKGSQYAGVSGGSERLGDVTEMYQHIPPLTELDLRGEVCEDHRFPHETVGREIAGARRDDPGA